MATLSTSEFKDLQQKYCEESDAALQRAELREKLIVEHINKLHDSNMPQSEQRKVIDEMRAENNRIFEAALADLEAKYTQLGLKFN
jgi:hypothetical protein